MFDLPVALRKESVDRNSGLKRGIPDVGLSLSARRAWIEIGRYWRFKFFCAVALRKESVDRNYYYADKDADWVRRSPQGERG